MPLPVVWVPPAIGEAEARRRLERARRRSLACWLQALVHLLRVGDRRTSGGAAGKFELVHLPCALVEVRRAPSEARTANAAVESATPGAEGVLRFLVDGFAETVQCLRGGTLISYQAAERPAEFVFPLSEVDTLALVRRTLTALQLGRVLPPSFRPAEPFCFRAVLQYPYWVHLFRRGARTVDLLALDAVTGHLCGETTHRAFVRALEASAPVRGGAWAARA